MLLLSGHSLTPVRPVEMEALQVTLKERDATATAEPADMEGIGINSWMLSDRGPGKGTVWRVRSIRQSYANRTPQVDLEHAVNSLRDVILFGETKAANISGGSTCTAAQAIRYILARQSDWVLGQMDYNVSNPYRFDGDSLYEAIETVCKTLPDCWWTYDMSVYPFRLNIIRKPAGVASELNPVRNLRAITKTIDKSGMYTRFYPIGYDNLQLSGGGYVEKNTALYGVIAQTETDNSKETEAELRAWANERLERHAQPVVSIDAEGLELADATGESLDRLTLGRICRIPLPEFGTTIEERIIELSWPDAVHEPESVRVKLANTVEDVTSIIAENMKTAGRSARKSARVSQEDHAWFEDTDDHVAMVATGIIGTDANGNPNWTRLSEVVVDGQGIHQSVKSMQGELVVAEGKIDISERQINQFVRAVGADGEITAASIVLAINDAGESEARIDANKVYIGNQKSTTVINGKCSLSDVTADYIAGKIATIATLGVNSINGQSAGSYCSMNEYFGNSYKVGVSGGGGSVTYNDLKNGVYDMRLIQSGSTYTLQKKNAAGGDWETVGTFNRAVTSLEGAWSDGVITVTPSGASSPSYVDHLTGGTPQVDPTDYHYKVSVLHYTTDPTRPSGTGLTIDVESVYQAGYEVTQNQISVGNFSINYTGSISGKSSIGSFSKSSLSGNSYILLNVTCHGTTKQYYITVNN